MRRIAPETGATWSAATVCWSTATSATVQVMSHCSMVRAASACAAAAAAAAAAVAAAALASAPE